MNRTRQQLKAAKARKEWQLLKEKQRIENTKIVTRKLKKVTNAKRESSLRDTA